MDNLSPTATPAEASPPSEPLDLRDLRLDPRWALQTPPGLMVRRRFIPLLVLNGRLQTAVERSLDGASRNFLQRLAKAPVDEIRATGESIREMQARLFGDLREAAAINNPLVDVSATRFEAGGAEPTDQASGLFDQLLTAAILRNASDMHFNVREDGAVQMRLRVNGELIDDLVLPANLRTAVFNRIKVLSGLDIAEKRASQDGSFRFKPARLNKTIEVRTATIPARSGERITLRLLAVDQSLLTLEKLGMAQDHRDLFARSIHLAHGMILLTGPTGSGKSTTLYAGIKHILGGSLRNIMTVEDPIEYEIDGVTQTEVAKRGDKVSFANSLRSILRHDPDVIMLGEIRDRETAELAIRAALTGHLVLSTLHTNTAAGAVTRLLDLGIDRYLLASVLRLVAAQRLVRTLCPHCRELTPVSPEQAAYFHQRGGGPDKAYTGRGCLYCAGQEYAGRSGLFEMIPIGSEEAEMIHTPGKESVEQLLVARARERGLPTMVEDGLRKIDSGTTEVAEVIRVTAEFAAV